MKFARRKRLALFPASPSDTMPLLQLRAKAESTPAKDEARGKPMAIEVTRLDPRGKPTGSTVVFYCQCGMDNSILIDGMGGDMEESWGITFDSLSATLKDRIIDYLCELEISGDVSKYVREYAGALLSPCVLLVLLPSFLLAFLVVLGDDDSVVIHLRG